MGKLTAARAMAGTLVAAAGLAVAGISAAAETVGPVSDALGVVRIAKGAAIEIGGYWTLSEPDIDPIRQPSTSAGTR